jgi:3'-phosphoadenosine 5'-phosphosulfate sulfotransferase (PAPS reductase)/FAD synthetase
MMALAFSGGKDSMACFFLMKDKLDCAIYVDTGFSYPETYELVDMVNVHLPLHIVRPDRKGQNERYGSPSDVVPINWTSIGQQMAGPKPYAIQSYLQCCYENIGEPLLKKAKDLGVTELVYGQRNEESFKSTSRNGAVIDGITRLHPIEDWTTQQVFDYLETKMTIPPHFRIKHSSLDCYDCTAFERDSQDRLKWTAETYPQFYEAYAGRRAAIDSALKESLLWHQA